MVPRVSMMSNQTPMSRTFWATGRLKKKLCTCHLLLPTRMDLKGNTERQCKDPVPWSLVHPHLEIVTIWPARSDTVRVQRKNVWILWQFDGQTVGPPWNCPVQPLKSGSKCLLWHSFPWVGTRNNELQYSLLHLGAGGTAQNTAHRWCS